MHIARDRTVFDPLHSLTSRLGEDIGRNNPYCFITIKPNQGGLESRDFCSIIARMLEKYCDKQKIQFEYLEKTEFTLTLRVEAAVKKFLFLKGLHKLVRVSPFGHGDKVHTSLCKVFVSAPQTKTHIHLDKKDIRMDFFKSTGPGGQHRNKTMSAVRLVHIPTNTVVTSDAERSQHDNRRYAYEQLYCKLEEIAQAHDKNVKNQQRLKELENNQIVLSYYFNHNFACYESNGQKINQLKQLLNGNLDLVDRKTA